MEEFPNDLFQFNSIQFSPSVTIIFNLLLDFDRKYKYEKQKL